MIVLESYRASAQNKVSDRTSLKTEGKLCLLLHPEINLQLYHKVDRRGEQRDNLFFVSTLRSGTRYIYQPSPAPPPPLSPPPKSPPPL